MTRYKISYINRFYKLYLYLSVRSVILQLFLFFKNALKGFANNMQVKEVSGK
ncbi:TPA: hypothetical protein ACU2I5_002495 [Staphylococcus aureus]